jgi:L,D-transpeptidase ErfK/SrfK
MLARLRHLAGIVAAFLLLTPPALSDGLLRDDLIGDMGSHVAVTEDTLLDLALEHDLGYVEIVAANPGVDPWLPRAGTLVVLPTMHVLPAVEHHGIVINLAEMRLYWFPRKGPPVTMPLGIGSAGASSPRGRTKIVAKRTNPTWRPTASLRAEDPDLPASVPPGPDNPLGSHALYLGWRTILLHGTNRPYGIGRRASHGCFRLSDSNVERLFKEAPIGTPVLVIDQPVKLGWRGAVLYLEIHPTQSQADELERGELVTDVPVPGLRQRILDLVNGDASRIDWERVVSAAALRSGVPVAITR